VQKACRLSYFTYSFVFYCVLSLRIDLLIYWSIQLHSCKSV